jgi:hypothetical protein
MRYIKSLITFIIVVAVGTACRDNSLQTVPFNEVTTAYGGYIREVTIASGAFNAFKIKGSSFALTLEVYDAHQGNNFQSVDVFVNFRDNTSYNGTITTSEVKLMTIDASQFTADATTKLPRYDLTVAATAALTALSVDSTNVGGTDAIEFRQALNLKDGRTFTNTNTGLDVLAGPFYGAPFFNSVSFECPLPATWAVGAYKYQSIVDTDNGPVFGDPQIITLAGVSGSTTQRKFSATYLAALGIGNGAQTWTIEFACNQINFLSAVSNLGCGQGSLSLGPATTATSFTYPGSDSFFTVNATDAVTDGGCGQSPKQIQFTLTKQ